MTEPGRFPDKPPTPRWVKVFAIVAILLVITVLVVHLAGGGFHHHMPE